MNGMSRSTSGRLLPKGRKNQMLIQAAAAVHTARQKEDAAYRRFSGKDFASDDLKGSASRMQSQACLCYAEAQPAFAR